MNPKDEIEKVKKVPRKELISNTIKLVEELQERDKRIKELEKANRRITKHAIFLDGELKSFQEVHDYSLTPEEAKGIIEENRKKYKGHNIPLNSAYVNSFLIETFKKKGVEL